MAFPLKVMFESKYANRINKISLKEFIQKATMIESEILIDQLVIKPNETFIAKANDLIMNTTINIGFPDELTSLVFLNKLYANLNLTGEEGVFKMHQEIKKNEKRLKQKENYSIYLKNLSENAKIIFEECRSPYIQCVGSNVFGLLILNI